MRPKYLLSLFLILLTSAHTSAADRQKIRAVNIGAQAVMTLVSGAIQGHVRTPRDVARCLLTGSISGYGFYEAKAMIGRKDEQTGWVIANMAGSLSENVAAGRHPLSQVGYSIGPFRVRVPIARFDSGADAYVLIDASEYQAARLINAARANDRPRFRSGLIGFERDTVYERNGDFVTVGLTYGMYPGVWVGADETTWPHEVIHAVQSLQYDVLEPSIPFLTYKPAQTRRGTKRLVRFEHLKLGVLNFADEHIVGNQRYHHRWNEIEAFRLAQGQSPTVVP